MNIYFIIQFNKEEYGGMYFSSTSRIKYFISEAKEFSCSVFNIRIKPPKLICILKNRMNKRNCYPDTSIFNGLECKNLYLNINYLIYFKNIIYRESKLKIEKEIHQISSYFNDVDLIVAHFANGPGTIAYFLAKHLNKRFSVIYHGSDIHTTPFINKKHFNLTKNILQSSSANIFVSNYLMNKSFEIFDTHEKSYVLYNPIDVEIFKKASSYEIDLLREKHNLKKLVIGFVGNLIEVKNVLSLVTIFHFINTHLNSTVSFIIIGDGNLKNELLEQFKLRKINVHFLGRLAYKEMPKYFSLMNILILPSKKEGLGRVIIEAQACGTTCVGSKVGGIPELVEEKNCFKLDETFEKSISNRICELLLTPEPVDFNNEPVSPLFIAHKQLEIFSNIIKQNLVINEN